MPGDLAVRRDDPSVNESGGRCTAEQFHVFDKSGEFGQVLNDLWLRDKGAGAAPDFR